MSVSPPSRGPGRLRRAGRLAWSSSAFWRPSACCVRSPSLYAVWRRLDPPGRDAGARRAAFAILGGARRVDRRPGRLGAPGALVAPRRARPGCGAVLATRLGRHPGRRLPAGPRRCPGSGRRSPVASIGILKGWRGGLAAGAGDRSGDGRRTRSLDVVAVSNGLLVVLVGGTVGYCADLARAEQAELSRALAQEAGGRRARPAGPDHPRRRAPGARLHPPAGRGRRGRGGSARAPSRASRSSGCAPWSAACPSTSWRRRSGVRSTCSQYLRQACRRDGRPRRAGRPRLPAAPAR